MVKITVTKIIKSGYDEYKFLVNGVETTSATVKEHQQLILGVYTRFDCWGLFSGVGSKTKIGIEYGKYRRTFTWERLTPSIESPTGEIVKNLRARIADVKKWIKTLPEDSEESVTFTV